MQNVKGVVDNLVKRFDTNDPFTIAKEKHIVIEYATLGNVLGFHQSFRRSSVITIHNELSEPKQRFVCAHELGHAIMHPDVNTPFLRHDTLFSVGKIEREANEFAVELLIPDEALSHENALTVQGLSMLYGVPYELMGLKIKRLSSKL